MTRFYALFLGQSSKRYLSQQALASVASFYHMQLHSPCTAQVGCKVMVDDEAILKQKSRAKICRTDTKTELVQFSVSSNQSTHRMDSHDAKEATQIGLRWL